jgi:hypothetical protein
VAANQPLSRFGGEAPDNPRKSARDPAECPLLKQAPTIRLDSPEITRAIRLAASRVAERDAKQENGMYALEAARVDLAAGHRVEGEKWLQSALDTNPELVPALAERGAIPADKGDTAGAESCFGRPLKTIPITKRRA